MFGENKERGREEGWKIKMEEDEMRWIVNGT